MTYQEFIEPFVSISEENWVDVETMFGDITEAMVDPLDAYSTKEDLIRQVLLYKIDPNYVYLDDITFNENTIEFFEVDDCEDVESFRIVVGELLKGTPYTPIFYSTSD